VAEWTKIKLLVARPAGNPVPQLRMSYEELRRRSTPRTTLVEPLAPRQFRICEPSLICAFSYRDVIEATPIAGDVCGALRSASEVTVSTDLLIS
jgi:hypothetical protein